MESRCIGCENFAVQETKDAGVKNDVQRRHVEFSQHITHADVMGHMVPARDPVNFS